MTVELCDAVSVAYLPQASNLNMILVKPLGEHDLMLQCA